MNHFSRMLLSAAAVLALAGCSSASTTSSADSSTATAEQTQATDSAADTTKETTDTTTNDQTTSDTTDTTAIAGSLTDAGAQIQEAFTSNGYTIYDLESEPDEISFDARNSIGTVEVDLEQFISEEAARRDFLDETSVDVDESLTPGDVFVNKKGSLVVLYNDFNNICEVEAVDAVSFITYSIDDIEEADLDSILSIMEHLGFAIQ